MRSYSRRTSVGFKICLALTAEHPGDHDGPRRNKDSGRATHAKPVSMDEYWMPFTPNRDFKHEPKMVVRAEGMYLWNERGDRLIDASSGLFCVNAGHCRKEIARRSARSFAELDFIAPFTRGHPKQFELASRVAALTPGDLNRHLLHELGFGSGRHRDEGRARVLAGQGPGWPHDVHLARACVPRRQFRWCRTLGHGEQPPAVRADAAGHCPHAAYAHQGEFLSAWRGQPRRRAGRGSGALHQFVRRREHCGVLRRADRGVRPAASYRRRDI